MAKITVYKARREMVLTGNDGAERVFPVIVGRRPIGHKEREGDLKTPEGLYRICTRNPRSDFHLSLGISYPNEADAEAGYRAGAIDEAQYRAIVSAQQNGLRPPWNTALGGFIMIHGGGIDRDGTRGCIGLRDADIEAVWAATALGDEVTIEP